LEPADCSICYEEYDVEDEPLSPCGHYVHMACMLKWKKDTCPVCRGKVIVTQSPISKEINLLLDTYLSILSDLGKKLRKFRRDDRNDPDRSIKALLCLLQTNHPFTFLNHYLSPNRMGVRLPVISDDLRNYIISIGPGLVSLVGE